MATAAVSRDVPRDGAVYLSRRQAAAPRSRRETFTALGLGFGLNSRDGGSGNSNDSLDAPSYIVVNFIIKT